MLNTSDSTTAKMKRMAETSFQKFMKKKNKEKDKGLEFVLYDELNGYKGTETVMRVKNLMTKNSVMYALFAPELEHLFCRMYASIRHTAELCARKENIDFQLKRDEAFLDGKEEHSPFEVNTGSKYATVLNKYMSQELRRYANSANKEIDKKIEFMCWVKMTRLPLTG